MQNKEITSPDKYSESPYKKYKDDNPDKKLPNPDDPNEEMGPPIKGGSNHPHDEEILDYIP